MSTKGILSVGTPQVKVVSSQNTVIDLKRDPGYYANVKIIINYPSPYITISEYTSGNLRNSYTIDRPYQITYILTDDDQIMINDPNNNYDVIVVVQFVQATSEAVMLYRDVRFKALPVSKGFGSVIFTSSQNWVVPSGVHKIKILAVGGGGGGGGGYSSTYTGGGGGSGQIMYSEVFVEPGTTLTVIIGAGGIEGTGGASPTAGGNGGASTVSDATGDLCVGLPGLGGGGATSTANGANASAANVVPSVSPKVIGAFGLPGSAGNGLYPASAPVLPLGNVVSTANIQTIAYKASATNSGAGGAGGAVNSNGNPGQPGEVIIWWGD